MFITFEGLDFCGKSTQVNLLEEFFLKRNNKVKIIREPGGTLISEKIRDILLDKNNARMNIETEIFLFSASRAQVVREVIRPHLDKGYYVIADRFHDSTFAYQGYGREIPLDFVCKINQFAIGETIPDLTFFIDIPLEEVNKRKSLIRNSELDRIETSKDDFYCKVREGYLYLTKNEKRFKLINGVLPIDEIQTIIHNEIINFEKEDRSKNVF
jgi:dTMP kinase